MGRSRPKTGTKRPEAVALPNCFSCLAFESQTDKCKRAALKGGPGCILNVVWLRFPVKSVAGLAAHPLAVSVEEGNGLEPCRKHVAEQFDLETVHLAGNLLRHIAEGHGLARCMGITA